MSNKTYRRLAAEFTGTFILVFAGTGAVIADDLTSGQIGTVGIGLTFGLAVMTMVYVFGSISGAHINPAVTFAMWATRRFSGKHVLPYVLSQCAGAASASAILSLIFPSHQTLGATLPTGSSAQSFFLECLLAFVLLFVILALSIKPIKKRIGPAIVIGAVVGLEAIFAGPISGGSMNPARSLGPAIISGHFTNLWIYLSAPTIGALLAIPLGVLMFGRNSFLCQHRSHFKVRSSRKVSI